MNWGHWLLVTVIAVWLLLPEHTRDDPSVVLGYSCACAAAMFFAFWKAESDVLLAPLYIMGVAPGLSFLFGLKMPCLRPIPKHLIYGPCVVAAILLSLAEQQNVKDPLVLISAFLLCAALARYWLADCDTEELVVVVSFCLALGLLSGLVRWMKHDLGNVEAIVLFGLGATATLLLFRLKRERNS
jgi:threonine/homoserine efflux transporter RhtA